MKTSKIVKPMCHDWQKLYGLESEKYILLTPGTLHEIAQWEEWDEVSTSDLELFVKVTYGINKKYVYRKAVAKAFSGFKNEEVMIAYRTRKQLKVSGGDTVTIERTNWFAYLWHNLDSAIRWPFRIAVLMGIGTIIQWVKTICCSVLC